MSDIRTHPIRVGSIEATVLDDGPIEAPGAFLFENANEEQRDAELKAAGIDPAAVPVGLSGMLLKKAAGERILLDAGTGGRWHEGLGKLPAALERIGCSPVAIDLVVVSHGHPDHLGGLLDDRGRPRFPKARYVMSETEWRFWTSEPALAKVDAAWADLAREVIPRIADQLWLTNGVTEISQGVFTFPSPGHTPGHIGVRVNSEGESLLWFGDAISHPLGIEHPGWNVATDHDPDRAERTRHALLGAAGALGATVFVNHFPFPAVGRVETTNDGWTWRAEEAATTRAAEFVT